MNTLKGYQLIMNLFVLAGIKSISNLFDGSFFVPYLLLICHSKKIIIKWLTRCTACLYGMLSRIILRFWVATVLLPESECKGKAIFWTSKQIASFFWKNREKNQLRSKKHAIVINLNQKSQIHQPYQTEILFFKNTELRIFSKEIASVRLIIAQLKYALFE